MTATIGSVIICLIDRLIPVYNITGAIRRWSLYTGGAYMQAWLKPQSDERLRLPTTCDYMHIRV